nr:MAG TPA: hypothetical protein [Caudoviricetes sp.]
MYCKCCTQVIQYTIHWRKKHEKNNIYEYSSKRRRIGKIEEGSENRIICFL